MKLIKIILYTCFCLQVGMAFAAAHDTTADNEKQKKIRHTRKMSIRGAEVFFLQQPNNDVRSKKGKEEDLSTQGQYTPRANKTVSTPSLPFHHKGRVADIIKSGDEPGSPRNERDAAVIAIVHSKTANKEYDETVISPRLAALIRKKSEPKIISID